MRHSDIVLHGFMSWPSPNVLWRFADRTSIETRKFSVHLLFGFSLFYIGYSHKNTINTNI